MGLDIAKFNICVDNGTHNAEVQAQSANPPTGATGTPTLLVNGTLLTNFSPTVITTALDKALGTTSSSGPSGGASPAASGSLSSGSSGGASSGPSGSASPLTFTGHASIDFGAQW